MSEYNNIIINDSGELEILEERNSGADERFSRKNIQKITSAKVLSTVLSKKKRTFVAEDANLPLKMFMDDDPSSVKKEINLKALHQTQDEHPNKEED